MKFSQPGYAILSLAPGLGRHHVALPEPFPRRDLLDHVDPEPRGIAESEPALAKGLVGEDKADRPAPRAELLKRCCSILDLQLEAHARARERLRARRRRRMIGAHESQRRALAL